MAEQPLDLSIRGQGKCRFEEVVHDEVQSAYQRSLFPEATYEIEDYMNRTSSTDNANSIPTAGHPKEGCDVNETTICVNVNSKGIGSEPSSSPAHLPLERSSKFEVVHRCDVCQKVCKCLSDLNTHKQVHTGRKSFKCIECDMYFSTNENLVRHARIHTGEKPYKFDQCASAFNQKNHLIRHRRTHTGEKPFLCEQCDAAFSRSWSLVTHRRMHTGEKPYKCDQCNEAFAQTSGLTSHRRTHTREKPYNCELCNQRFSHKQSLKNHQNRHTEELPYPYRHML